MPHDANHPRERFLTHGGPAISDAEVLALVLDGGNHRARVQAEALLDAYPLAELARRDPRELARVGSVGLPRALRLAAGVELARRLQARPRNERPRLSSPEEVSAYYGPSLSPLRREVFHVAMLDSQNGLVRDVRISEGSLSASIVHPREVFRSAILESAAHLILVHNHPSGDPTPSKEDIALTRQLCDGARLLGLRVHDHVIIGENGKHTSLALRGLCSP